jgi:hypothetical protein
MLESDGALLTWRLDAVPEVGGRVNATRIGDHRLAYLEYEGLVSGGRGSVRRIDAGTYAELELGPDETRVKLSGGTCRGVVTLAVRRDGA